jgi:hypothetical protein
MTDPFDRDDWESREVRVDDRPSGDDFWGYDTWKSDVGPWPSIGDDPRPTRSTALPSFWEGAEIDLTGDEVALGSAPDPETVLDLAEDVIDLVDDVDDRTT